MKKGEKNTAYDKLRQDVDQGSLEKLYQIGRAHV